jgi:hypothetical protein
MHAPIRLAALAALLAAAPIAAAGCAAQEHGEGHAADSIHAAHHPPAAARRDDADSAYTALQARGKAAMGVDQYRSKHLFDALPDGGRIELRQSGADSATVRTIREHMREIARMFAAGDFSTPAFVHLRDVPGTAVMAARRDAIRYEYRPLPDGAELRMTTADSAALAAIHEFMAFQRGDHRAGGRH